MLVMSHLQDCAQALQELQSLVRLLGGDRSAAEGIPRSAGPGATWGDRAATERPARESPAGASEGVPSGDDLEPLPPGDSAAAHRHWSDLRAALACDGDGVILDECERGGSRALEVYRNALDDPLPGLVRAIVLRQFEDVMTNHDQIRDLRSEPSLRADSGAGSGAQAGQH